VRMADHTHKEDGHLTPCVGIDSGKCGAEEAAWFASCPPHSTRWVGRVIRGSNSPRRLIISHVRRERSAVEGCSQRGPDSNRHTSGGWAHRP